MPTFRKMYSFASEFQEIIIVELRGSGSGATIDDMLFRFVRKLYGPL